MKKLLAIAVLGLAVLGPASLTLTSPAPAQGMAVFDATNYSQNLLTAARTLQSVNQQIQQLQNEAQMLTNMAKHLKTLDFPQLDALKQKMAEIDKLMGEAQGLNFKVSELDSQYQQLFPQSFDQALRWDQRIGQARARLDAAAAQFRQTMGVQAKVVENVHDDAEALKGIVSQSQGAEGSLQAQQATNQLLALAAKQQFQLQQLQAAKFRSEAVDEARRAQSERDGKDMTRRFLGDGKAYTPR
jgi:P-type conjugative transfer protein TrbJ